MSLRGVKLTTARARREKQSTDATPLASARRACRTATTTLAAAHPLEGSVADRTRMRCARRGPHLSDVVLRRTDWDSGAGGEADVEAAATAMASAWDGRGEDALEREAL